MPKDLKGLFFRHAVFVYYFNKNSISKRDKEKIMRDSNFSSRIPELNKNNLVLDNPAISSPHRAVLRKKTSDAGKAD
ncbi:MAG: hypothetical protein ACM339_10740 [Ignavibacteria bacterium]